MADNVNRIAKKGLCLGCGLCETIYGKANVSMEINDSGFYYPKVKGKISKDKDEIISRICPSVNITNEIIFDDSERIWGHIKSCHSAFSLNKEIRTKASSGGLITQIATYLLRTNLVDAVLQVGSYEVDYQSNKLKVSRTEEEVLACAKSRYAPAKIFNNILNILESSNEKYCFVGKPCDISGIKNLLSVYPQYKERFVLFVSIMCAGMPSYIATSAAVASFNNVNHPITNLTYRGNGWPGYFSFEDSKGICYKMSYNDSWGKILGKHVHFRCKICPDGIGLQADIAVGDAWETKDGYPDFTEKEGDSLLLIRTKVASDLIERMSSEGIISKTDIPVDKLPSIQPFQAGRRHIVGARILAASITKIAIFRFKNLKIFHNLFQSPLRRIISEFYGTAKRVWH